MFMKAAVITEHGGREVLAVQDVPEPPAPGRGEAQVRMYAVALNRLDIWVREGWPGLKLALPHVTCADGAGVVEAIGEDVTDLAVGDRVSVNPGMFKPERVLATGDENLALDSLHILGENLPGVAAERVNLPARNLLKMPENIAFEDAAAAGLVYLTAWHSLIEQGGLKTGESVLVVGAGGGVNSASIQIACHAGATVYVVGSNAEKCEQAKTLGAHVTINREETPEWSKQLYKLTDKQGVDVVVDNVGQATMFDSIRSVKRGGRILIVGNTSGPMFNLDLRYLFSKHISLIGSTMGTGEDYRAVMRLVFSGALKPVIGATLPLEDIAEGHRLLEKGEVFGKVVLQVNANG